jgi:hypothetical protein
VRGCQITNHELLVRVFLFFLGIGISSYSTGISRRPGPKQYQQQYQQQAQRPKGKEEK